MAMLNWNIVSATICYLWKNRDQLDNIYRLLQSLEETCCIPFFSINFSLLQDAFPFFVIFRLYASFCREKNVKSELLEMPLHVLSRSIMIFICEYIGTVSCKIQCSY